MGDIEAGSPIGRHMARGALWMVAMRWCIRLIGLVNTAIIARVLAPQDFGLVALGMVVVDLLVTMTDGDIEMALVRKRDVSGSLFNTGWSLKILAGTLTCTVLWLIAGPASSYFHDPRIETVIRIAALRPLILGFENIGVTEFRRTLSFSAEFRYLVAQKVLAFVSGLTLVFVYRDYFALAWSMPVSALLSVGLSYVVSPMRPRWSLAHWQEMWLFSRWQLLFNGGRLVGERWDQLILDRLAGVDETGIYTVGFDLAMMPTREIMMPAGRALMPAYARLTDDPEAMRGAFKDVLAWVAVIASSIGVGMSCVAADAVRLVLGDQWLATIPYVRWLGVFGALEGAWLMLDPFLIAARHEKLLALSNLLFSALAVILVTAAALTLGVHAIPFARIAAMAILLFGLLQRMSAWRWISLSGLVAALWRPLAASVMMAASLALLRPLAPEAVLLSLMFDVGIGASVYLGTLFGLWFLSGRPDGVEAILFDMVVRKLDGARA